MTKSGQKRMRQKGVRSSEYPKVFGYESYRRFIADFIAVAKTRRRSQRQILREANISNPSFFLHLLTGRRNLTQETAHALAAAFRMGREESSYFCSLVALEHDRKANPEALLAKMRQAWRSAGREKWTDESIQGHWLYGLLYVIANIKGLPITVEGLKERLGSWASPEEIQQAISFLTRKGLLTPTAEPGAFVQRDVQHEVRHDIRRIDVQRIHLHYLRMAMHRIHRPVEEREYYGTTFAVPAAKFSLLKERIRRFMQDLEQELDGFTEVDAPVRLQIAAFHVFDRP